MHIYNNRYGNKVIPIKSKNTNYKLLYFIKFIILQYYYLHTIYIYIYILTIKYVLI